MSPLESRKRLLVAESELNRAQLADKVIELKTGVQTFTSRATPFASVAVAAITLMSALTKRKPASEGGKRSWLQIFLKTGALISSFLLAYRARERKQDAVN